MMELGAVLVASFLGSAHCVGMCGGFALSIGLTDPLFRVILRRQLVYSLGRITTYAFLGALGGFTGLYLGRLDLPMAGTQQIFSMLAGGIMLYVGLNTLGLLPVQVRGGGIAGRLFAPLFAHFIHARAGGSVYLAGLATGFLPCGLVYSFLALAAASGDVARGVLLMACFGLGTVPAMVLVGCGGRLLRPQVRVTCMRAAACLVIAMGGVTIWRAIPREQAGCCHAAIAE